MNLLQLQYFYVVAKEGGFTKASKALRIQQPAISRMVQQLEESMQIKLFERIGRTVQLTTKGREVFEHCKTIFSDVEILKTAVGQMKSGPQGPLHFGASEPIASHLIPAVFEELLKEYPNLYPNIFSGTATSLFNQIKSGELEFGLFFHVPDLLNGLKIKTIKKVRFHLVIRKDLKNKKFVMESFIGSREIDDTSTKRFPTLTKLKKIHPEAKIRISSNNITAHKEMVLRGLGVAVLPDFLVQEDLKNGILTDVLPKEQLEFELKLVERSNSVLSLNAQSFLGLLK
jgi:DNA-binding transcriptional LysR family regulator